MIFILSWILLRKKSGDQARCFISCACPEPPASLDFSFRARAGSRRRKQPLFFLRYMWRTRRVITQWNFPRTVQFPWRTLYLFFSLSLFFVFLFAPFSFFFFGRSSFEIFHKVRLLLPTLSSSSLDRACWDASGIVLASRFRRIHRHGRLDFSVDSKKRKKWQRWEKEGKRESVVLRLFLLDNALVINDGHSINKNRIHIPIISNNLVSQKCDEKWGLILTKLQVLSWSTYLVWSDEFKN